MKIKVEFPDTKRFLTRHTVFVAFVVIVKTMGIFNLRFSQKKKKNIEYTQNNRC